MIRYFSGCTNPPTEAAAKRQPRLGMLAQPGNSIHLKSSSYVGWGVDNGVFGHARSVAKGLAEPWSLHETAAYLDYLIKLKGETDINTVRFATAPDVLRFACLTHDVPDTARPLSCRLAYEKKPDSLGRKCKGIPIGDAKPTWEQSKPLFGRIRRLGFPVGFVAQDGVLDTPIEWDLFDALFIGGSDGMKLGAEGAEIAQQAKMHGKWVHMGRVNSRKRLVYAASIGCDSADGTFIGFGPNKNLPKVLTWLEATATPAPAVAAA